MVVDGASTHASKELHIPSNVALRFFPPYSPELNPVERLWNVLRRDCFSNRYFETLDKAIQQVELGLSNIEAARKALQRLTCWGWINNILKST
jgi:transposase